MKIAAGITHLSELKAVLAGGADEVYGGILGIANHRPMTREYSFGSVGEFAQAIRLAHAHGRKIYFLANELYADPRLKGVLLYLKILRAYGIDGVLVRDLPLVLLLRRMRFDRKIILSSLAVAFNSEALRFYRDLGVGRVVLPQHVRPQEIPALRRRCGIEMEAFFNKTEFCCNIDGLCLFHSSGTYRQPRRSSVVRRGSSERFVGYPCKVDFRALPAAMASRQEMDACFHRDLLEDFRALFQAGVEVVKLKRYRGVWLLSELWLARQLLQVLRSGVSRKKYLKKGAEAIVHAKKIREGRVATAARTRPSV
jgi:collagenase-like PrtC family protease